MIDPATALAFSMYENAGVYALLLGSGVSRSSRIPTGWETILELARKVGALEEAGEQADWAAWYRQRFGQEPNYSDLLDMLSNSPSERRAILHHYIEPTPEDLEEGRKVPTKAHRAIAKLVRDGFVRVIVTTNFDRLMESALQDEGVQPSVIRSDDDLAGAAPIIHSRCTVIKIHGDYLDTRIRNTEEELQGYSALMNALLDRVFDDHGLVVAGWSADWDHALRAAIARAPSRRYPLFWASRGELSVVARDLIDQRKGIVIPIADADTFFERLQQKSEVLASLNQSNPRSLELLVASAKRYVAKPEHRVQLHDLVDEEARRLKKLLEDPRLGADGSWSDEQFREKVAIFENSIEALVRVFATLGRWGTGDELPLVVDLLRHFGKHRVQSGLTAYIGLKTYPAVLLFYAYGIGALKAGRFSDLFHWLSTPIEMENLSEFRPASNALFLWDWVGDDRNVWQRLDGLDQHKTPLSDNLHNVFSKLISDLTLDADAFEMLFERFELYVSIANGGHEFKKADLQAVLDGPHPHNYARIPIGRTGWHSQTQRVLFEELKLPETEQKLLSAGFAQGDAEFLAAISKNLARIAGSMRW